MARGDWWWIGWAAGSAAGFAVLETKALRRYPDPRYTLTAVTRRWLGVHPERPRRAASSAGLIGALAVFAAHMLVDPPCHRRWAEDPRFVPGDYDGY